MMDIRKLKTLDEKVQAQKISMLAFVVPIVYWIMNRKKENQ